MKHISTGFNSNIHQFPASALISQLISPLFHLCISHCAPLKLNAICLPRSYHSFPSIIAWLKHCFNYQAMLVKLRISSTLNSDWIIQEGELTAVGYETSMNGWKRLPWFWDYIFMLPKGEAYSRCFIRLSICPVPCPANNFKTTVGI